LAAKDWIKTVTQIQTYTQVHKKLYQQHKRCSYSEHTQYSHNMHGFNYRVVRYLLNIMDFNITGFDLASFLFMVLYIYWYIKKFSCLHPSLYLLVSWVW